MERTKVTLINKIEKLKFFLSKNDTFNIHFDENNNIDEGEKDETKPNN